MKGRYLNWGIVWVLQLLGTAFSQAEEVAKVEQAVSHSASIPESTVAIALGGILWFLLLRKRA